MNIQMTVRLLLQKKFIVYAVSYLILQVCPLTKINGQEKTTEVVGQAWLAYNNQTRFADKWGTWTDLHLRTKENVVSGLTQSITRLGLTYYLTNDAKLTAGYAFVNHFPGDVHKNISRPEHRPWQQVQWHTNSSRLRLMQWFRLEERFRRKVKNENELAEGYLFNFRMRYNIMAQFPLGDKKFDPGAFSFAVTNEAFINFGKEIINNYFDQNRFFAGFHYHINKTQQLQFGYLNVFQQLPAGNQYRSIHAARIFYFHNIDLRKEQANKK